MPDNLLSEKPFTGKDLSGMRFGRMTVIGFNKRVGRYYFWNCRCDCGNEKSARVNDLTTGKIKSCGCLKREVTIKRNTTHGLVNHRLYHFWGGMRQRCRDVNRKDSKHYSLKGVQVCERWQSFEKFLEDMESSYVEGLTLHRKDSSKGYEPGNVVWADWETQNTESTNARIIEIDGESHSLAQWCRKIGISYNSFYNRIKHGWTESKALTTPKKKGYL